MPCPSARQITIEMNVMFLVPSGLSSRKYDIANAKRMAIPRLMAPFFMISQIMDSVSVAVGCGDLVESLAGIALLILGDSQRTLD
jgi:hypothetical protein